MADRNGYYQSLIDKGIISKTQACELQAFEKVDGTEFTYTGRDSRPDVAAQNFQGLKGEQAAATLGDIVLEDKAKADGLYDRDIIDPHVYGKGLQTRHYDNMSDNRSGTAESVITQGVAEPSGEKIVAGIIKRHVRAPTAREEEIYNRASECFLPKLS